MSPASYSLIIATFERPDDLAITFAGIEAQTHRPAEIIVVDSSRDEKTRELCATWENRLPVRWVTSNARSAAKQRNEGAAISSPASEVLGFMDDDISLYPSTCAEICHVFAEDPRHEIG